MAGSSEKASKRRALIVGGSMSGLLAALLLRRAGWDVDVFERVESELAGRGAGIVAQPDLIETLRRLGIRWMFLKPTTKSKSRARSCARDDLDPS